MNKTTSAKITLLITGSIITLLLLTLFNSTRGTTQSHTLPVIPIAAQQKQADNNQAIWQQKIDGLNRQGTILSVQLLATKTALGKAKKKNQQLQGQLTGLINSRPPDSLNANQVGEELRINVRELLLAGNEKDSLYDVTVVNLERQLNNKDTILALQQEKYRSLKSSFETSLLQQELLTHQNIGYRKQWKRQKFKQKLVSAAMVIVAGSMAYRLINN